MAEKPTIKKCKKHGVYPELRRGFGDYDFVLRDLVCPVCALETSISVGVKAIEEWNKQQDEE